MQFFACGLISPGNVVHAGRITVKNTGHFPETGYNAGGADENGIAEWQSFDDGITHRFDLRSFSYRSPMFNQLFVNGRCPEGDAFRAPTSVLQLKFSSRWIMDEFCDAVAAAILNVKAILPFMPDDCLAHIFACLDGNAQKALKLTARTFRYTSSLLPSVKSLIVGAAKLKLRNALKLVDWALGSSLARHHGARHIDVRVKAVTRAAIRGALAGGSFELLYHVAKRTGLTFRQLERVRVAYGPKSAALVKKFLPHHGARGELYLGDVVEMRRRVIYRTGRRSDGSTYVYPITVDVDDDDSDMSCY